MKSAIKNVTHSQPSTDRLSDMRAQVALGECSIRDYHNARTQALGDSNWIACLAIPLASTVCREIQRVRDKLTGRD